MKINPFMFRGYDLRGIVDRDLNPEIVENLGRAHGTYMRRHGVDRALVARDSRATSPAYSEALLRGYSWAGIDCVDIGMNLVGTFYWAQHHLQRPGGAMVSASHNPAEYNGFKFSIGYSETLVTDGMNELRRMVEQDDFDRSPSPGKVVQQEVFRAYCDDIIHRLPLTKSFRVVVDASCSTAGVLAPQLLRQAGCDVIECHTNLDPSFPLGTPDPTEGAVARRLRDEVLDAHADVGFTYDPDGDRIGIVDEKGTIIWNDVLVALFAIDVLSDHPGATIMFNTLCSTVVPETIRKYGGTPFMWRTGHSFLKKKNQEIHAAFIGELSGHFFFSADFYNHDDGLYSTLRLLRYLSRTNQTLSQALAALPKYVSSPEIKLYCADDQKAAIIANIAPQLRNDFPDAEVIDDERAGDGVRLDLSDGMLVIRYSQNGPYLTVKFEANDEPRYAYLQSYLSSLLHKYHEIDWASSTNVNVDAFDSSPRD